MSWRGLTVLGLSQDGEDRVVGLGAADVLQDALHAGRRGSAGQERALLAFQAHVHDRVDHDEEDDDRSGLGYDTRPSVGNVASAKARQLASYPTRHI